MIFNITYWDGNHAQAVTKSTGTVSKGATYAIGNDKDDYDLEYAGFNGDVRSVKPKSKDYYFE